MIQTEKIVTIRLLITPSVNYPSLRVYTQLNMSTTLYPTIVSALLNCYDRCELIRLSG